MGVGGQHCLLGLHALWGLRAAGLVGGRPRGGWPASVVRGIWCQALSLPQPPVLWGGQPGFQDPCVPGAVRVGVGTQRLPHSVRPCGPALLAVGPAEGHPRGGCFHRCEGRLRSGAPPPPTAGPLGGLLGSATHLLWARVSGRGGPTLSPWPASPVGAACRGVGGRPSPRGVARHRCEGRLVSGAVPPPPPILWDEQPRFRDPCVPGAVGAGVGTQHQPHSVRPCGPALLAVGVAEGHSRGGVLSTVCEGRLWSGAPPPPTARPLGRLLGSATHVLWAWVCERGGSTLSPWPACPVGAWCRGGGGGPSPWGMARHRCEGRLVSGAVPSLAARALGRAARVSRPVCPGCSWCGRGDPARAPWRAPLRAGVARCGGGGRASPGGVLFAVLRGVWGQALPSPGCPPSGRAVGVRYPRAVGAGVRAWGPCTGPVARVPCGGLRATGLAGGVWVHECPLSCCSPSGRAAGARWPRAVGVGVGVCGVCGVCAVRVVVRDAAFLLSLWCSPLRCFGAVWCPPCAVCLPCSLLCARPLLGCWLPLVSFVASSLFTLSSARPSPWHALFPCLRPGVCLCLFLRRLVFLSRCAL